MSIESHFNTTANICVATCHFQCVVNLLLAVQNGLSINGLIEPHLKLPEGNIFTPVCQSFCSQGGWCTPQGRKPLGRHPPRQTPLGIFPKADTPLARHP